MKLKFVLYLLSMITAVFLLTGCATTKDELPAGINPDIAKLEHGKVYTARIMPDKQGGCSLLCVYMLNSPVEEVWELKSDFTNVTGLSGPISESRIISRTPDKIVYEAKSPQITKWLRSEITLDKDKHIIRTKLMNPTEMGMRFMNSEIRLEPSDDKTIVYWRNNLSLKFWPDAIAASLMLPKMEDTAVEDRRLFTEIVRLKKIKPHDGFINMRK